MGYICPYCGEGLPDEEYCSCSAGASYDEEDYGEDAEPPRRRRDGSLYPRQPGDEHFYLDYEPGADQCPPGCLDHSQHIYILCYGRAVLVRDRDYLPRDPTLNYPITHYVGYTGQRPPVKRVREHRARSVHHIAAIRPGSMRDEAHAKRHERCPSCGGSLWYYAESPTYSEEFARHSVPGQVPRASGFHGGDR